MPDRADHQGSPSRDPALRNAGGIDTAHPPGDNAELTEGASPDVPVAPEGLASPLGELPSSDAAEAPRAALGEFERGCAPTPLTPEALAEALRAGHIRYFGTPPHADRWACAWAHCAFEQAWGSAIFANNIGHITVPNGSGRACTGRFRERIARDPDRWEARDLRFRVFDTPAEGAEAYWRLLTQRYYSVLARCDGADARGAAQRLSELGYFTGPEDPYVDGMARLFVTARGALIPRIVEAEGRAR